MRGQFWFCFLRWEVNFGFWSWEVNFGFLRWEVNFGWWQSGQTLRDGLSAKESHLRESLQISLSPSGSDPSLNDASLMTRPAPHFLEVTFPHFWENRLMVKNQPIVMFVKASDAVSWPHALFGLCWPQPIRRWLWWCKLYFSDCRSVFLRWCISQILPGVFLRSCKLYIFLK